MQLLNYTQIPSTLLRSVLAQATRDVKAHATGALVCINWTNSDQSAGHCGSNLIASTHRIPGKTKSRGQGTHHGKKRRVACYKRFHYSGRITVSIPRGISDAIAWAEHCYDTMLHEWAHLADWQNGGARHWDRRHRLPWAQRPQEEYAIATTRNHDKLET